MEVAAIVAVFQVALSLGAPLGKAAWGDQHEGVLPDRLRISSGLAGVFVYPLVILFVLASSYLISADCLPGTGKTVMWILAGLFTIGALGNFASRSKIERIWGSVSLAIAICCGVIANGI